MSFDITLFQFINNLAGRWFFLDALMIFYSEYLIWLILAFVVGFLFWLNGQAQKEKVRLFLISLLLASLIALGIRYIIPLIYSRARPFVSVAVTQLIQVSSQGSFPSGHTIAAFVLALSVYLLNKKMGYFLLFLALLVAFSRIYVGVHYPLDVVGGMMISLIVTLVIYKVFGNQKVGPGSRRGRQPII